MTQTAHTPGVPRHKLQCVGMRDDNAARDAVVKAHLKDADVIIITSNIKRGTLCCCVWLYALRCMLAVVCGTS